MAGTWATGDYAMTTEEILVGPAHEMPNFVDSMSICSFNRLGLRIEGKVFGTQTDHLVRNLLQAVDLESSLAVSHPNEEAFEADQVGRLFEDVVRSIIGVNDWDRITEGAR
jgi:hypothetical protein